MTAQRQAAPIVNAVDSSATVSFPLEVLPGSLVVVAVYSTAPGPGYPADFFAGLGGTWNYVSENEFFLGYSTDVTGGTDVVVSYPFSETWAALAIELTGAPAPYQTGGANGSVETGTVDVSGGAPDARAGWLAIYSWVLPVDSITTDFTDTNGSYTVNADVAAGIDVELAWADIPAAGPTNHVGNRGDTAVLNGGYLFFGPIPVSSLVAPDVAAPQLVIPMVELDEFGVHPNGYYLGASRWGSLTPLTVPTAPVGGMLGIGLLKGPFLLTEGYFGYYCPGLITDDTGTAFGWAEHDDNSDTTDDQLIPIAAGDFEASAGIRLGPMGHRERVISDIVASNSAARGDQDWKAPGFQDGNLLTLTNQSDAGSVSALIAHWRSRTDYSITSSVDATAARDAMAADASKDNTRLSAPFVLTTQPFVAKNVVSLIGQPFGRNTNAVGLWDLAANELTYLGKAPDWFAGVDGLNNPNAFFGAAAFSPGEGKIVVYGTTSACDFPAAAVPGMPPGESFITAAGLVVLDAADYHVVDAALVAGEYSITNFSGPVHHWIEPGIFPDHRSVFSNSSGVSGPIVDPTNDRYCYISRQWDPFPEHGYNVTAPRTWSTGTYGRTDHKRLTVTAFYRIDLRDIHAAPELVIWLEHTGWDAGTVWPDDHELWWFASACGAGPGWLFADPFNFPLNVRTAARGKIVAPLHIPKPGPVPALFAPPPPIPPPPTGGLWYATPDSDTVLDPDGFAYNGYYNGAYLRLFRVTLIDHIPTDWIWVGPANATDNRTDGTGMFLEVDLFDGPPGDPSHAHYGRNIVSEPWDHNDRYHSWTGTESSGFQQSNSMTGADDLTAGLEVWLLAQQWPDGEIDTLPFDPYVNWDPTADMGSFTDSTGTPVAMPWDMSTLVEVAVPVPSALWGP